MTHGRKAPATITGPQLNITLSLGNCTIINGAGGNKTLNCTHPHMYYVKVHCAVCSASALGWALRI